MTHHRCIVILKQMPAAPRAAVTRPGLGSQERAHIRAKGASRADQQLEVSRQEDPVGHAHGLGVGHMGHPLDNIFPIALSLKVPLASDPPARSLNEAHLEHPGGDHVAYRLAHHNPTFPGTSPYAPATEVGLLDTGLLMGDLYILVRRETDSPKPCPE